MFAWLKMSEICTSPFHGGDRYYDIDLVKELDMDIWKASVALQESAEYEYEFVQRCLLSNHEICCNSI